MRPPARTGGSARNGEARVGRKAGRAPRREASVRWTWTGHRAVPPGARALPADGGPVRWSTSRRGARRPVRGRRRLAAGGSSGAPGRGHDAGGVPFPRAAEQDVLPPARLVVPGGLRRVRPPRRSGSPGFVPAASPAGGRESRRRRRPATADPYGTPPTPLRSSTVTQAATLKPMRFHEQVPRPSLNQAGGTDHGVPGNGRRGRLRTADQEAL